MGVRENKVEKYLHDEIVKLGGFTWKFVSPNRIGVPDRIVRLPKWNWGIVWFVEIKTEDGKLSSEQVREQTRMQEVGLLVTTVYGEEGVDEFLEEVRHDPFPVQKASPDHLD